MPLNKAPIALSWYSLLHEWQQGQMSLPELFVFADEIGVDGVELLDAFLYPKGVTRDFLLDEATLADVESQIIPEKLLSLAITNDFGFEDSARLSVERQKLKQGIRIAKSAAKPVPIRTFVGNSSTPEEIELCRYRAIDGLKNSAEPGYTFALENHGPTFNTPDRLNSVLQPLKDQNIGVCFDIGNFILAGIDPRDAVAQLPPPAIIHVKDFRPDEGGPYANRKGEKFAGCRLGDGVVPLSETLALLHQKCSETPVVVIELECGPDGKEASRHAATWLREELAKL